MSSEHVSARRRVTSATPTRVGGFLLRAFPRAMGAVTVGYAVAVLFDPELMTGPMGLSGGAADPGLEVLTRAMLARDLACGAAMMFVPAGWPLLTAIGIRVASDFADAVIMGSALPAPDRTEALLAAGGFGVLCALSALGARRRSRRSTPEQRPRGRRSTPQAGRRFLA